MRTIGSPLVKEYCDVSQQRLMVCFHIQLETSIEMPLDLVNVKENKLDRRLPEVRQHLAKTFCRAPDDREQG